jgi:hypothetical protein
MPRVRQIVACVQGFFSVRIPSSLSFSLCAIFFFCFCG